MLRIRNQDLKIKRKAWALPLSMPLRLIQTLNRPIRSEGLAPGIPRIHVIALPIQKRGKSIPFMISNDLQRLVIGLENLMMRLKGGLKLAASYWLAKIRLIHQI